MAHGYESYVGAPFTNAPMCAMDADGFSLKIKSGPAYCFLVLPTLSVAHVMCTRCTCLTSHTCLTLISHLSRTCLAYPAVMHPTLPY